MSSPGDRYAAISVFGVIFAGWAAFLYQYKPPPSGRAAHASQSADESTVPKSLEDVLRRRVIAEETATTLEDWVAQARSRMDQKKYKDDANLRGDMARVLLESAQGSRPPSAERLAEGRRLAERAAALGGRKSMAALSSQLALKLAEGRPEEALASASALIEASPLWSSHASATHAYLAAACAKACRARRQEQLAKHAPEGTVFKGDPPDRAASTDRAAAMWRVMEAGRTAAKGADLEPDNKEAQAWKAATKRLVDLNAYKISKSDELFELGGCHVYEGLKLNSAGDGGDGSRCPAADDNPYAKKKGKGGKKKAAAAQS